MARPRGAGVEDDLDLDGGVAARVEDLTADDVLDGAHVLVLLLLLVGRTLRRGAPGRDQARSASAPPAASGGGSRSTPHDGVAVGRGGSARRAEASHRPARRRARPHERHPLAGSTAAAAQRQAPTKASTTSTPIPPATTTPSDGASGRRVLRATASSRTGRRRPAAPPRVELGPAGGVDHGEQEPPSSAPSATSADGGSTPSDAALRSTLGRRAGPAGSPGCRPSRCCGPSRPS